MSGGEIATVALRQLPNVTHYGATTRGSFSTVLSKPLPNGWVAELSNERFLAPDGVLYEETGITPDVALEVSPSTTRLADTGARSRRCSRRANRRSEPLDGLFRKFDPVQDFFRVGRVVVIDDAARLRLFEVRLGGGKELAGPGLCDIVD